jgi:hypothetical protein
MKLIIGLLLISTAALAECDVEPLKEEMSKIYVRDFPIEVEDGQPGIARIKNIVISDFVMRVNAENFLIGNFDAEILNQKGELTDTAKTVVVGNVDIATCRLEKFNTTDLFGSSMSATN